MKRLRRLFKPAALWLNAALYKVSEDEIQLRNAIKLDAISGLDGADANYFASLNLRLSSEQFKLRLYQRKLREQRDRIHQW